MLLNGVRTENYWLNSEWKLTYPTGWDFILKAAFATFPFLLNAEILVDEEKAVIGTKNDILKLEERKTLTIRGLSEILKMPIMITFYNQLNIVYVKVPVAVDGQPLSKDYESFNKLLCPYLDSLEISMYG